MADWWWKCPECEAPAAAHGQGDCVSADGDQTGCAGLHCNCPNEDKSSAHGTVENPCTAAKCDHCGWSGLFPPEEYDGSDDEREEDEDVGSPSLCPSCKTENFRIIATEENPDDHSTVYTKRCMCGEEWSTIERITRGIWTPVKVDPEVQ
jgi:hypothetical protein